MQPDISVIIPVYNRGGLVQHTIRSVRDASSGLRVELVVVDDGSETPLEEDLRRLDISVEKLIRQSNQGLLLARLAGFKAATGRTILFLDSDDLISQDKLRLHLEAMREGGYDVTYSDHASLKIDSRGNPLSDPIPEPTLAPSPCPLNRFPEAGLPPHSPVFDAEYLRACLNTDSFPPNTLFNSVAEIWFYHHCFVHPTRAKHIPGPHSIVCLHEEGRITDHWEVLCMASLCVMEHFVNDPPLGPYQKPALAHVADSAFNSWRGHPHGMPSAIQERFLAVWKKARVSQLSSRPPPVFRILSSLIGTINLARILRRLRRPAYDTIRTMPPRALQELIASYPPPASLTR